VNIAVKPSTRHAVIDAPAVLAVGEAQPVTLSGLDAPDLSTLRLAIYGTDGGLLALCAAFVANGTGCSGILDTRTVVAVAAFVGKRPDERLPVIVVLSDLNRLWCSASAEMANNPLCGAPVAPNPALRYVTRQDFSGQAALSVTPSYDELAACVRLLQETLLP